MSKKKITIAISGLNNTDNPGPGIPVIRGLREAASFEAKIIGLAYENLEPGAYLHDLVDHTYLIPYPSQGVERMLNRIRSIHQKEGIDVLIPNFDAELLPLIKSADLLKTEGIQTFLPTMEQYEERMKSNLPQFGEKYNVLVPKSFPVSSPADLTRVCRELEAPFMIKGKFYDAYLAHNPEEALGYYYKISAKWGLPVIVQQYVRGTEVNVVALGDGKGQTIGAVPMKKQYITDKGKAWGGIAIADPFLLQLTDQIISQTRWRGGMELELVKTSGGRYFLIEINPRIPAWVYLAVGAGQNLPEALVRLALDQPVEPFKEFKVGTMFIRYSIDMIVDVTAHQRFTLQGEL